MLKKKPQKLDHIVLLRVIAITLVVLAHATRNMDAPNVHMYSPYFTPFWERIVREYIYSFHMPLFIWISGYIYYYSAVESGRAKSISMQLLDKTKRLLLPMFATSFLVLLPTIYFWGHLNGSLGQQAKLLALGYDNDHLWFLKSLFLIFCVFIPLNKFLIKNGWKILFATCCVWLVLFCFYLPMAKEAIKLFPFFLIGVLSRMYEGILNKGNPLMFFTIFWLVHLALFATKKLIGMPYFLEMGLWYLAALTGVCFMYFLIKYTLTIVRETRFWNIIVKLDVASYSIYLFHVTFLYMVLFVTFTFNIQSAAARVVLSFILGLLLPIAIHHIILKSQIVGFLFGASAQSHNGNQPRDNHKRRSRYSIF